MDESFLEQIMEVSKVQGLRVMGTLVAQISVGKELWQDTGGPISSWVQLFLSEGGRGNYKDGNFRFDSD